MLSLLHIENIAVIEAADLTFDRGFNVLTGETGAGKSIVIDAINAILGERTYRDVIRTGANKATVRAVFTGVPELAWFSDYDVPYGDELLVQRQIFLDGKNVCRVNGLPVTVATLKKLGLQLVQIHGQHDSQQLFDEASHLACLDSFAGNEEERAAYRKEYDAYLAIRQEIARLQMDEGEKLRLTDALRHQIEELTRAKLQPGEYDALRARQSVLQNAEKLEAGLETAIGCLYGDESSNGAEAMLSQTAAALHQAARFDDALAALSQRAKELMYEVQDLSENVRARRQDLSYSEAELEQAESRIAQLQRLFRKYGADETGLLTLCESAQQRLDQIEFSDDRLQALAQDLEAQKARLLAAAKALRATRRTAGARLSDRIVEELRQLDMPRVQFVCQFEKAQPSETGMDVVRFLMSANAGEALKPMSRVASGGELARIMLAIKNVMAERDAVPTLIFDEVDAGVSGRAAQRVAEKLASVAKSKQVLCVTHLPQIAAMADCHLRVSKSERAGRTYTAVEPLARRERELELARLIGGAEITETTISSAAEMLRHDCGDAGSTR